MTIRLKFTEKGVQRLPAPTDSPRQIYTDRDAPAAKIREAVPGLQLSVFRSGNRSFVLCRKFQGKTRFITLGKYPDLSVEMARAEAREHITNMRKGIDPGQNKQAILRKQITLREVFKDYLKVRQNHLSKNTVSNYQTVVGTHLGTWQTKEMRSISRNMVQKKHAELSAVSPTSANKAMRVLRALFNFANGQYENEEGKGLFPDNPVSRLSHVRIWNKESRRQNKINNTDLKSWFDAVLALKGNDEYASTVSDYLQLMLLTGMRRREAAPLKWADINFQEKVLTVGKTKNGDPLLLPLSDYLHAMLGSRRESVAGDYVFPGGMGNHYLSEPKKHIDRIRKVSGVHFTLHDLRRTFITIAESLDIPAYALKKLMNHRVKGDVTEGYIIMSIERLRAPMQQVTDYIMSLAEIRKGGKIVELRLGNKPD